MRWIGAAILAVAVFVACWAVLQFGFDLDAPVALGWAIIPFSVFMALGGFWADRSSKDVHRHDGPAQSNSTPEIIPQVIQKQHGGNHARQFQVGRDYKAVKDE